MPEKMPLEQIPITDDLSKLLAILPSNIAENIDKHPQKDELVEIVMDLGRLPEARFSKGSSYLSDQTLTKQDLEYCLARVGTFSGDNRAGIERTLHRISGIRNRNEEIIGLTCRVGRAIFGTITMIRELVESGQSILLLGRPGVGKTTALREIARVLADDLEKRVIVIDTSNEIAGDGDIPHSAIGRARRMQVARPELQHQVMIEAVENHTPEVIIIDEIGTELEAMAARTIAERGVQLVGTAHGNRLDNLIKNPTLSDLVGGIQAVTLGDDEARRRNSQKTVLERKAPPTFAIAIEMIEKQRWVIHQDVAQTVDALLRGYAIPVEVRTVNADGEIEITQETPRISTEINPNTTILRETPLKPTGWRASGRMTPIAIDTNQPLDALIEQSWSQKEPDTNKIRVPGPSGEDWPIYLYPYGIARSQLEQIIDILNLPIVLTKDFESADAVLALRSQIKNNNKLRQIAKSFQIPIYGVKSNSMPQISYGLKQLLNLDESSTPEALDLNIFAQGGSDDEIEALEEARLAVEQIVLPRKQPVELLPRSAKVRKMQHELVEHYRLQSDSMGEEPNRRLRIYPS